MGSLRTQSCALRAKVRSSAMRFVLRVAVAGSVLGCGEHDAILNQIHQHNAGYPESSGSTEPDGTGSTGSTGPDGTGSGVFETTNGLVDFGTAEFSVQLSTNTDELSHVGSVVLTLDEFGDKPDSKALFVRRNGVLTRYDWPTEKRDFEVIVGPATTEIDFTVVAQSGNHPPAIDSASVTVDLPDPGTLVHQREGVAHTTAQAVLVEASPPGFADRVIVVVDKAGAGLEFGDKFLQPLFHDSEPIETVSASFVGSDAVVVAGREQVRFYRKHSGVWHRYWSREFEEARIFDVAPRGDDIVVAGERLRDGGGDAAVWVLTTSGGTRSTAVFSSDDESTHVSSIRGVSEDGAAFFGSSTREVMLTQLQRASVFEVTNEGLVRLSQDPHPSTLLESRFFAGSRGPFGVVAAGSRGDQVLTGGAGMIPQALGPGRATATVWSPHHQQMVGGVTTEGAIFVDDWSFMDGQVHDMRVDRFGLVHVAGHVEHDGVEHALILTVHP